MIIRKIGQKDIEQYKELFCYCFNMEEEDAKKYADTCIKFGNSLCVEQDGRIVSAMAYYPFKVNIREQKMNMAGLTGVVTLPQYRNRGYVREQLKIIQSEMIKNVFSVSYLEPFKYSFYQKYGWTNAAEHIKATIPIDDLRTFDDKYDFIEVTKPKVSDFKDIEVKFSSLYNGCTYREDYFWENEIFYQTSKDKKKHFYLIKKDNTAVAYVIYRLKECKDSYSTNISVSDYGYYDYQGMKGIFCLFKEHRDQCKNVIIHLPVDFDLFHFAPTHQENIKLCNGMMFKVVDVENALTQLKVSHHLNFDFTLKITDDPICPENCKEFSFFIKDGNIKKIDTSSNILETDICSFSQLFIGKNSIRKLIDYNFAKVKGDIIPLLDITFPRKNVFVKDWF